jgi:hypothetical protein
MLHWVLLLDLWAELFVAEGTGKGFLMIVSVVRPLGLPVTDTQSLPCWKIGSRNNIRAAKIRDSLCQTLYWQ